MQTEPSTTAPTEASAADPTQRVSGPLQLPVATLAPELEDLLASRGVRGLLAVLEGDASSARCSDVARCAQGFVPASTFKVPNSIIGLETGVIADADYLIAWDGVERTFDSWNHDHTLRTAIRDSAVWYYQELARRVGPTRMQEWVDRLQYGNRKLGDRVDQFWLEGPLLVTPLEQLDFLRRLETGQLPITPRTRDIVRDIIVKKELDGGTLRGKTGWAAPGTPNELGWFVGYWTKQDTKPRYVVSLVLGRPKGFDMLNGRQQLAEAALHSR